MLDITESKGIVPRHNDIAQHGESKGQQEAMTGEFPQVAHYVVKMIRPELVMEDPERSSEKEQAE